MLFLNGDPEESKDEGRALPSKKRTINQREAEIYRVNDP
jgi:hypothetical protein